MGTNLKNYGQKIQKQMTHSRIHPQSTENICIGWFV